jgi:Arc/MetJ-type ribon-helix-helix transcriptional regulator
LTNIYTGDGKPGSVPKVSLDMPGELVTDLKLHVGDDKKFVSLADAIRTACRKLLDQLDEIDQRHGRGDA